MNNRNIFIFWIGKEFSLIKILRELIYLHSDNGKNYKVHFLNDNNISDYIKDIPKKYFELRPAHKADYVRVNVICDYGGIWLDSDTIVMNDLSSLFKIIEEKDGFFIKENNIDIINGVFGSKKNTPIMIKWKIYINQTLLKIPSVNLKQRKCWTIFSSKFFKLFKINKKNKILKNYKLFNGLNNLYPIYYKNCVKEFINKNYDNYSKIKRNFQPVIILVNSVYKALENLNEEKIKKKKMPINYFINESFKNCK